MIKFGRLNIIVGSCAIFVAAIGGFALGKTLEGNFTLGVYAMTLPRLLLKAGHSHGMPFAFYNLIIGLLVDRLELDDKWKKYCSVLAVLALFMPIGLALRGAFNGSAAFEPIPMFGALCYLASAAIVLKGALAIKAS
jgi:hypothetical protein